MNGQLPTAPASGGESQNQNDPGLDTAMGNWGDGENGTATPDTGTQTAQQPQQQQEPVQQTQQAAKPAPSQQTPPTQDNSAAITAAIEATARAMSQRQQPAPAVKQAAPMSDAEFAQRYGIQQYDAKYIERLFDKDPAKAAEVLNEIQRNAYTAAVRMANDLISAHLSQTQNTFAPRIQQVEKFISEQNEKQASDRFYKTYADLVPESDLVKEILDATQAKISRGEIKFDNEQQAFKFIADATNSRISAMRAKYSSGGAAAGGQQAHPGTRQMAQAAQAARPGGQQAKPKGDLDSVMASWDETPE